MKMMTRISNVLDLTRLRFKERTGWVALTGDKKRIVGHAQSLKEVVKLAHRAKITRPVVFKLGPFETVFAGGS